MEEIKFKAVEEVFSKDGPFAQNIPDYVTRDGQVDMAKAVSKSIKDSHLLVAEAGTGTGKTFAYLVPALLAKKKIVISTASKALQDQIIINDIPRLIKILGIKSVQYMVLKGFSNYLCMRKYDEVKKISLSATDAKNIDKIINEERALIEKKDQDCSFCEVNSRFSNTIVSKITCSTKECEFNKCPYFKDCFPRLARERATECNLVVINHALFFSSIQMEIKGLPSLLPPYDILIFDEAHSLPEVGRSYFSKEFKTNDINSLKNDFDKTVKKLKNFPKQVSDNLFENLTNKVNALKKYLEENLIENAKLIDKINVLKLKYQNFDENKEINTINAIFRNVMGDIYLALRNLHGYIIRNKDFSDEFESQIMRLDDLMDTIKSVMVVDKDKNGVDNPKDQVAWVERQSHEFSLTVCPLEIGLEMGSKLRSILEKNDSVIMTSATLSVNNNFNKFIFDVSANLITDQIKTLIIPSFFNYNQNSLLYLSKTFPDVKDPMRIAKIIDALTPAINAVKGGIFFLTTSYKALHEAGAILKERFKDKRKIFVQGSFSNKFLMDNFKKDGHAILVGTSSFWEGVDVPGNALSMVIIDKIPFASPGDPLVEARAKLVEKKGLSSFRQIYIPEAVIALRQGVGRLIRKEHDTGAMIICDPRLLCSNYGNIFIQSLPDMQRCDNVDDLVKFLQKD